MNKASKRSRKSYKTFYSGFAFASLRKSFKLIYNGHRPVAEFFNQREKLLLCQPLCSKVWVFYLT